MAYSIESFGVLGGGTAGYLTAIALKKNFPQVNVSLIESSNIPIIGVGEATFVSILNFLHNELGFDLQEFYQKVRPTLKLGIHFEWGLPGDYYFNYPIEPGDPIEGLKLMGDINQSALSSILMNHKKSFIVPKQSPSSAESFHIANSNANYAYHLDNKLLVTFLKEKAVEIGVELVDATIDSAKQSSLDGAVTGLLTSTGELLSYDFYFDCSGFRSLLMGATLKNRFIDYKNSLFTDRAIAFSIPNGNSPCPYTSAITMPCGWMWNTPLREADHMGYVYSSGFCSDDEAWHEINLRYPEVKEFRVVKFTSGRYENFCQGNVIAIGNAHGFIEPLEATGIHMITRAIQMSVTHLKGLVLNEESKCELNRAMNEKWDQLRWFIALHYKYNKRLDTPFWKACRSDVDTSGYEDLISMYEENGPLRLDSTGVGRAARSRLKDCPFSVNGLDMILSGQGVLPNKICLSLSERQQTLRQQASIWTQIAQRALSHNAALKLIEEQPDVFAENIRNR
tara:strand:+ start:111 stop:1637 length:1527 start_codon:yes stop_codon:yes gene_type:complete